MENSEKNKELEKEIARLKLENKALTKAKENFDLFVNHMDDFVWIMNKDFEFTYVSPSVKNSLGYSVNEFLRGCIFDMGTPETKAKIKNEVENRISGKAQDKQKKWITQVYNKNGINVWIETSTNPILNNKGEFDGLLGVSRNISENISIQRKIQENEANLVAQIENTADSIWSIDDAYCIKTINTNFRTYFKMAFGVELNLGTCIVNSLPDPFRAIWKERYDKALKGEHYSITDHFAFQGVPQYVEVSFNPIVFNEKIIGVSCFSRDITSQKLSEQNLIETGANLSSLIEHTDARIWSIDVDYNIISINNNFRKDFQTAFNINLKKGSYALQNLPDLLFNRWKSLYDRVLDGEQFSIIDEFNIKNVPQFVEVSFNPIRVDKTVIGATCYSRDITQQKLSEMALLESEQRFKSLVANIPSVTYRCKNDKNWTMLFISDEITNLTGHQPTDFINNYKSTFAGIIFPEDREYFELLILEKLRLKQSFSIEHRLQHKNGKIKWVLNRGRGNYNDDGTINSIDGVISDITVNKRSEQELLNSELKFRMLSDASIDMMKMDATSDILIYISEALQKRLPKTVVLAITIDVKNNSTQLINITGIKGTFLNKAFEIIGFNPIGKKYALVDKLNSIFQKSKLTKFNGGLAEFSSNQFPKTAAVALQKFLQINEIHTIGIKHNDQLFAAIHFFTLDKQKLEEENFIASFINLAGIVLQRQQLIEALHHSEEKFRSIFEHTNSAISIQTDENILLVNKSFEEITGYSADDIKTLHPKDLVHPLEREKVGEIERKRQNGEKVPTNYVVHIIDKKFNEKWIDLSATVIDYEGQKASLLIGSDITERKKSDMQLNKFSTGIMNSPSSIVITDVDGTIEYVNPFFCEFTGYSLEEVLGKNPNILNSGNNPREVFVDMWNTILKGEVWNGELQNKKKNGQFFWEIARIAPIFDDNGILTNFIAIKEDITERKRTLELIEQSENDLREINAKKDKFFSIIAHDLRSPFSGLAGLTEILKSSIKELSEDQINYYLELISQSTHNISKLLENLLSWAKTQTGKMEFNPKLINLTDIINETIAVSSISAKNKDIRLFVEPVKHEFVFADENMLNTVLRNLISNALKYTFKNGKVIIFSREQTIQNKLYIVIGVKDNGVGIPKDKQNKLFNIEDNYSTAGTEKEKGTGLGLILCKEFVEKHGGKIWCESDENKGSTFYFSLPVVKKKETPHH